MSRLVGPLDHTTSYVGQDTALHRSVVCCCTFTVPLAPHSNTLQVWESFRSVHEGFCVFDPVGVLVLHWLLFVDVRPSCTPVAVICQVNLVQATYTKSLNSQSSAGHKQTNLAMQGCFSPSSLHLSSPHSLQAIQLEDATV